MNKYCVSILDPSPALTVTCHNITAKSYTEAVPMAEALWRSNGHRSTTLRSGYHDDSVSYWYYHIDANGKVTDRNREYYEADKTFTISK